ncbi:hypothetical protein B484DRAFT_405064 [Ochromonadaceae sp. CCMP2298]|nr:hypothetical protein B484DRAFT_405064 [Ochromonadaceae sp. CCMP2298]
MSNKPMQSGKPSQASERVSVRDPGAGQVNVQTNVGGGGRPHRSTGGVHNNSSRHSSVSMRGEEQLGDFDHGDDEESYSQSRRTSAAGMPARPTGALHGHQLVGVPPPMAITRQSSVKGVSIVGGGAGTARPSVVGGGSVVSAGSVVSTGGGGGGGALARHSSHQQAGGLVGAYGRPVAEVRKPSTHHHHHHYISPGTPDDDMHGGSVAGQGVAEEVQFQDEVDSPGAPGSTGQRERRVVTMKQEHVQSFPHQASDYSNAMEGSYGGGQRVAFPHHQQSQFLADLALNFEEISVKRKRVAQVPSVICESIADVTQEVADFMARAADFDMVQTTLAQVAGLAAAQELQYDENLVLKRRTEKIEEFLGSMAHLVIVSDRQNPGMVRLDARSLFLSLVKKSLDMFMSKHNQVLVVGNSRLGRVKIPSCLACDRPLIDKVRLDSAAGRGLRGGGPLTSSSMSALPPPGRALAAPSQASYGYGAPADAGPAGGSALYRWGDSDDEDAPATHSGGQKELVADLQQVMRSTAKKSPNSPPKGGLSGLKKATKLPEVQ